MIATLDTNVLIAAFISRGHCHELLEHLVRHHTIISSPFILDGFREKLLDKFKIQETDVESAVELLKSRVRIVSPEKLENAVSRDPDDDWILATAVTSQSDCIITGDKDLLVLEVYSGIPIMKPADFWAFEAK